MAIKNAGLLAQLMRERFGDPAAATVEATRVDRPMTDAEHARIIAARRAILTGQENRPRGAR